MCQVDVKEREGVLSLLRDMSENYPYVGKQYSIWEHNVNAPWWDDVSVSALFSQHPHL